MTPFCLLAFTGLQGLGLAAEQSFFPHYDPQWAELVRSRRGELDPNPDLEPSPNPNPNTTPNPNPSSSPSPNPNLRLHEQGASVKDIFHERAWLFSSVDQVRLKAVL